MEVLTLILHQFIDQDGGFSYHWRCDELQLFQLGFADDLLLFSRADMSSIHIFKRGLMGYTSSYSGISGRHLPLRYLGLPLLASRLTIADCKPILQKIDDRIRGWDGIMLSFAGRVQLIKSVLTALQGSTRVGYAKVSWQQVCRPVAEGGLGLRDILALNRGLMSWHLWRVIVADRSSIWVDWIIHYRLRGISIWTVSACTGSWSWRKLVHLRVHLRSCITYRVGSGSSFSLWHDPWHPLGRRHTDTSPTAPLSLVIRDGRWNWPCITDMESIDITYALPTIHGGQDRVIWTGPRNSFSSAVAYDVFCPPGPKVEWSSLLVGSLKIPRHRFILWLAILGRLSTLDKPWLQHLGIDCVLCRARSPETHFHLFFCALCIGVLAADTDHGSFSLAI
ncbi:UNVERIFIED_CONTAM: hypothetical protein Slati_4586700 [Sesamum latifolium]|uniref:Reverse transcriptase zinc-binding domain-containing protein n=1 Tax=Sesamum latifolium TaxID=2727402 RepID=A0AAW2S2V0_9LAMI